MAASKGFLSCITIKKSGFLSPTLWDFTRRMYVRVLLTKLWNTVTLLRFLLLWMGRISGTTVWERIAEF
mgnify:CR=1 FL=1